MVDEMGITRLRQAYRTGETTPADIIARIFARIHKEGLRPVWISVVDERSALTRAKNLDLSLPLAGIPFAIKDNIDFDGLPTTAGCPSYSRPVSRSATTVARLLEAGAILIGKTNMDQFATGLVGTRSPYGACANTYDPSYISGGSSSGSAVAVASGLCAFSLGTDTAGSGRIPAAFNNLIGLKPTRGVLSTAGVVPACRSLDCVSIFASSATDAELVWTVAQGHDPLDSYSRPYSDDAAAAPWLGSDVRVGVPAASDLQFFGDEEYSVLYEQAIRRMEETGARRVTIDFTPFREAAGLLYSGPWVAERFAAVGDFILQGLEGVDETVGRIIRAGATLTAADAFQAAHRLERLKRAAEAEWGKMDVLFLPTAGTIYKKDAVAADPVGPNSNLGYYTNFVNLMDLTAIAVPAGFRSDGLPFGVSIVGQTFTDRALIALARRFLHEPHHDERAAPGCVPLAVVGAHLQGQPLNHQLTSRGARLMKACLTSRNYRLFALADSVPPKPGLLRAPGYQGPGIEVEVWAVPRQQFGGFVDAVPPPLAIGSIMLETGEWVKGFVCEPAGLQGAEEITRFGGWRAYLHSRHAPVG